VCDARVTQPRQAQLHQMRTHRLGKTAAVGLGDDGVGGPKRNEVESDFCDSEHRRNSEPAVVQTVMSAFRPRDAQVADL
jgi:hypothetical protein